jgi:hypothetical protein
MTFARFAFVLGCAACSSTPPPSVSHYCQLSALTADERTHLTQLAITLAAGIAARHELDDGYSFDFPGTVAIAGEWLDDVRRCCPTLDFELSVSAHQGPAVLRITGAGAKPFIRSEFARLFDG